MDLLYGRVCVAQHLEKHVMCGTRKRLYTVSNSVHYEKALSMRPVDSGRDCFRHFVLGPHLPSIIEILETNMRVAAHNNCRFSFFFFFFFF